MNEKRFKLIGLVTLLGAFFSLAMASLTISLGKPPQFFDARNTNNIISELKDNTELVSTLLLFTAFDNLFVVGYMILFYGVYLLTREYEENLSKLALAFGWLTGIFDLIENTFNVFLAVGATHGFEPGELFFTFMWSSTYLKDGFSIIATYLFFVLFLGKIIFEKEYNSSEVIIAVLLLFNVITGTTTIVNPAFVVLRNITLVVVMFIASIVFMREKKG